MKIIFFGTPDFAVFTLEGILNSCENVSLVVTQPDKPRGRGLKLIPSPVKKFAASKGIEVITPNKIKSNDLVSTLRLVGPDVIIVSAYGKIIPKTILDIPKYYPINVHASLLPKFRGAAPINWAIINGEEKTGITIMKMNERMDAGDIIFQKEIPILPADDALSLHDKLAKLGSEMIVEALAKIKNRELSFTPQFEDEATYAPMLKKEDGVINWTQDSLKINNFIRGMNPWPGAYTYLEDKLIKIFKAEISKFIDNKIAEDSKPGEIINIHKDSIAVRTKDGTILIKELQQESKKRMPAEEFIKGSQISGGKKFKNAPV